MGAGADLDAPLQPPSWDTTSFPAAEAATFAGSAWAPGTAVPSPRGKKKLQATPYILIFTVAACLRKV